MFLAHPFVINDKQWSVSIFNWCMSQAKPGRSELDINAMLVGACPHAHAAKQ